MSKKTDNPVHFQGKDAVGHVVEAQARGVISKAEIHGEEIPGPVAAAADSLKEGAILLSLVTFLLTPPLALLSGTAIAWCSWRSCRSAWLGWSRLERLHRLVAEEKWEIDHHRDQEREELSALYEAKGFKGKLLEDVINVLMSDEDRLLRVMLEEEMGLTLQSQAHPLQLALGALLGAGFATLLTLFAAALFGSYGALAAGALSIGLASALSAFYDRNKRIPAVVWNLGLYTITIGIGKTLTELFQA